jgi:hypothetical protein
MDTTQMMMASGGMLSILIGLLMMLLPLILLLIAWRILKWSATTAQQATRLTEQMDELLQQLQGNAASTTPTNDISLDTAADSAAEEDDFDILAAAPAAATGSEAADFSTADDNGPETNPFADDNDGDETGFDFPVDEGEAFGGLDEPDESLEPADEEPDTDSPAAADSESEGEDFDFDLDKEKAEDDTFAAADLDQAAEEEEDDFFSAPGTQQDPLAGAFGADEAEATDTAADSFAADDAADEAADSEPEEEDRRMEESFDSAFPSADADDKDPAEEEAAQEPQDEEPPAIIQLDDDPARSDVSLARCGQCDHKLAYKKTLAGKKARCPSCKGTFILP